MTSISNLLLPDPVPLRAGALTMEYSASDLRYIHVGDHEILRRIYIAVRDANWNTIPAQLTLKEMRIDTDAFRIRFHAEHHQDDIDFAWDGALIGTSDSTLALTMSGIALSTFRRNRIGFCVLHPMSCAGTTSLVEHADGTTETGVFPVEISPHQPFRNIRAITHTVTPALQTDVRMDGDIFEMEDQRNWTDASYKTYCTPLDLPFPVEVSQGTRIEQSVTVRLLGSDASVSVHTPDVPKLNRLTIDTDTVMGRLPRIGLSIAEREPDFGECAASLLRLLNLNHLRVDVRFAIASWEQHLSRAIDQAQRLGVALELALHLPETPEANLRALREILDVCQPTVATLLIFQQGQGEASTPAHAVEQARSHLGDYDPNARFAGGTDAFFAQLNRSRPSIDQLDLLSYSINPQVHAFDDASLVETLPAQAVTVTSARRFSGGRGVAVSPVTFKMRSNPAATKPDSEPPSSELPARYDARQATLFGAGWTLGSIKYLSEGGAESVMYYETTGLLGVMAADGDVYPLFHILADVGEFNGGEVLRATPSQPLSVDGCVLRCDGKLCVLLANFTSVLQTVKLDGLAVRQQCAGSIRRPLCWRHKIPKPSALVQALQ